MRARDRPRARSGHRSARGRTSGPPGERRSGAIAPRPGAARRHPAHLGRVPDRAAARGDLHHAVRQLDRAAALDLRRRRGRRAGRGTPGRRRSGRSSTIHATPAGRRSRRRRGRAPAGRRAARRRRGIAGPDAVQVVGEDRLPQAQARPGVSVAADELSRRMTRSLCLAAPKDSRSTRSDVSARPNGVLDAEGREREGAVEARQQRRRAAPRQSARRRSRRAVNPGRRHGRQDAVRRRRRRSRRAPPSARERRKPSHGHRGEVEERRHVRRRVDAEASVSRKTTSRARRASLGRLSDASLARPVKSSRCATDGRSPVRQRRRREREPHEVREPGTFMHGVRDADGPAAARARHQSAATPGSYSERRPCGWRAPVQSRGSGARRAAGASASR